MNQPARFVLIILAALMALPAVVAADVYTVWVQRYDASSPLFNEDIPQAVAVDAQGNVYVTGYSWLGDNYDFLTLKYDPDGVVLWERRYDGPPEPDRMDRAFAVQLDHAGNLYVVGEINAQTLLHDYGIVKYDANGTLLWERAWSGPGYGADAAHLLQVDASGNIYVSGSSDGDTTSSANYDIVTVKVDADGNLLWERRYNGSGDDRDYPSAMRIDAAGNAYIAGYSYDGPLPGGTTDYVVLKYDAEGELVWERTYNGPADTNDVARDIAVDAEGNVYITGGSVAAESFFDIYTIKYNSAGDELWTRRHECCQEGSWDVGLAVLVDPAGGVYVAGGTSCGGNGDNFVLLKYDPSGELQWERRFEGGGIWQGEVFLLRMAPGLNGLVYLCAPTVGPSGTTDFTTVAYDSDGTQLWVKRFNAPSPYGGGLDRSRAIACDQDGHIYVTGESCIGDPTGCDFATIKYGPCTCPCHGDPQCDGVVNVLDVVRAVDVAFRGVAATADPGCPRGQTDVVCDDVVDVLDVTVFVMVAFRGEDQAIWFCDPCEP